MNEKTIKKIENVFKEIEEEKLKNIIENMSLKEAPIKTLRFGIHYEFIIGIGNDETASITMSKEAYEALMAKK